MAAIAKGAALEAGALWVSRLPAPWCMPHRKVSRSPGTFAETRGVDRDRLGPLSETGHGIMEVVNDAMAGKQRRLPNSGWLRSVAAEARLPRDLPAYPQTNPRPDAWRDTPRPAAPPMIAGRRAKVTPQVFARPVTILFSFQGENPFQYSAELRAPERATSRRAGGGPSRAGASTSLALGAKIPNQAGMSALYQAP